MAASLGVSALINRASGLRRFYRGGSALRGNDVAMIESSSVDFWTLWRIKIPHHALLVEVILKEVAPDRISVRYRWEKQDRILDLRDESQRNAFYELFVQRVKDYYSPQNIGRVERLEKIGFQVL
jgi:hypothetical protein